MLSRVSWVLLAYRIPRQPSTPRIAIWRRLKRLGVAQVGDGLVALPHDARSREQLEWIADEVIAAGVAAEYDAVLAEAAEAVGAPEADRRRIVARLRRELRRIGLRDYFPPAERESSRLAVDELAASIEVMSR